MLWNHTSRKRFERCTVATSGNPSPTIFGEEGYVAIIDGTWAGVISYALDFSFIGDFFAGAEYNYDTRELEFDWVGTADELISIAKRNTDLMFPNRARNPEDCDYKLISDLYNGIKKWAKKHNNG